MGLVFSVINIGVISGDGSGGSCGGNGGGSGGSEAAMVVAAQLQQSFPPLKRTCVCDGACMHV